MTHKGMADYNNEAFKKFLENVNWLGLS